MFTNVPLRSKRKGFDEFLRFSKGESRNLWGATVGSERGEKKMKIRYQSWKSRLSERFSPEREILARARDSRPSERFSPEREILARARDSRLSERGSPGRVKSWVILEDSRLSESFLAYARNGKLGMLRLSMLVRGTSITSSNLPVRLSDKSEPMLANTSEMLMGDDNVNLKPPTKYANLIDEAYWTIFVTFRTQDDTFFKVCDENCKFQVKGFHFKLIAFHSNIQQLKLQTQLQSQSYTILLVMYWHLEQSDAPSIAIDLNALWVFARKNKEGVIDNEQVQEVANRDTKDSQDVLDKALGLPQYFGRIRGVVLSESCTHPRHNIRIPKGNNSCKLFLDIPFTRVVGVGMVHNAPDAMLHNACIPSNHVRVAIDTAIEDNALLPIPLDEDTITLGGAIGTFVYWLVKMIIDILCILNNPCLSEFC
ncbi:hypothetical protein Lal_00024462 [Lupinus albus]|nr:hypothetical protein Lal_00024462 [Lupinus albus]